MVITFSSLLLKNSAGKWNTLVNFGSASTRLTGQFSVGVNSSDTLVEQGPNGQSLSSYRAHIRIDPQQSNPMLARVALKPGMTTTIDIKTRTRSVLQYLLKPVIKSFSGALNER